MKVNKQTLELMKIMKEEGKKQIEIAKELNLSLKQTNYWLSGKREVMIKKAVERFRGMSESKKSKYYKSRRVYLREYMRKRYAEDPIFREKIKQRAREWQKKV
jgi:predicted transcriptional regulator